MRDKDKDFTYIATELCDHRLDEWLKEVDLHPPGEWGPTASGLTKDLLSGLAYLHSRNPKILHRDVKVCFYLIQNNNHLCQMYFVAFWANGILDRYLKIYFIIKISAMCR